MRDGDHGRRHVSPVCSRSRHAWVSLLLLCAAVIFLSVTRSSFFFDGETDGRPNISSNGRGSAEMLPKVVAADEANVLDASADEDLGKASESLDRVNSSSRREGGLAAENEVGAFTAHTSQDLLFLAQMEEVQVAHRERLRALREGARVGETVFESRYTKIHCGALTANFCMRGVQPVYYSISQGGRPFTSSGATMLCNEGGNKHKMHMIMKSNRMLSAPPHPLRPILVVVYCWETYGYHLVLCLAALHAHLSSLGLLDEVRRGATIAVYKGIAFPLQLGSATSWSDAKRSPHRGTQPSRYWELWRVVADHPAQIMGLPHVPAECFTLGVFGGPPSPALNPLEMQRFKVHVWRRLGVRPSPLRRAAEECARGRPLFSIALIQRGSRGYQIDNIGRVVQGWELAADELRVRVNVSVVVLEELPLRAQVQLAVDSDAIAGVHGNGLTWVSLARKGAVCVELWPSVPYNANYANLAMKAGVKHISVRGDGTCRQRCSASYDLHEAAKSALRHLRAVACNALVFDTADAFVDAQASFARRKEERMHRRSRH